MIPKRRFIDDPRLDPDHPETTVIGPALELDGELHVSGDAIVVGRVRGDLVVTGKLFLAEEAVVSGRVFGGEAVVAGRVDGPVEAHAKLEVRTSARISGDLSAATLAVAEGARVDGQLHCADGPIRFVERRGVADDQREKP